jgi:hypothetical protein
MIWVDIAQGEGSTNSINSLRVEADMNNCTVIALLPYSIFKVTESEEFYINVFNQPWHLRQISFNKLYIHWCIMVRPLELLDPFLHNLRQQRHRHLQRQGGEGEISSMRLEPNESNWATEALEKTVR